MKGKKKSWDSKKGTLGGRVVVFISFYGVLGLQNQVTSCGDLGLIKSWGYPG